MRLLRIPAVALSISVVLATDILSGNSEGATRLMQRILTKTTSGSDTEELASIFGEASMPEGCNTLNLQNRACRASVVELLCNSGALITKAEIEAAGTKLEDPDVMIILCSGVSDETVAEASLSILKNILAVAELCCSNLKAFQIRLPASYLIKAVSKANLELLGNVIDCGVAHVSSSALSTAFLDDENALEMTMMLIEAGGDPNSFADVKVPIAFELIENYPNFTREMLSFMIDKGLSLDTVDNRALTLFDVALKYGRLDLAFFLDKLNAPTSIVDIDEIDDEDHVFNWHYFQFFRRYLLVMAAASQDGNAWNSLNPDLVNLISIAMFDFQ